MPSGRTHATLTAVTAASIYSLAAVYFNQQLALELTAGVMLGFVIEPDLDVPHRTYSEALMMKMPLVGPLVGIAWQTFWTPYSLIPHRSIFSHFPVLSDALRWLYLLAAGSLVLAVLYAFDVDIAAALPAIDRELFLTLFAGNCIATNTHFFADQLSSGLKRQRRRRKQRR